MLLMSWAARTHPTKRFVSHSGSVGDDMGPALGAGGVVGFCSGKAVKVAGEAVMLGVGTLFIVSSVLQKAGYVTINYHKIEKDILNVMDLNKDGVVDKKDYVFLSDKAQSVLADNSLGTSGGFAAGFALGLKM